MVILYLCPFNFSMHVLLFLLIRARLAPATHETFVGTTHICGLSNISSTNKNKQPCVTKTSFFCYSFPFPLPLLFFYSSALNAYISVYYTFISIPAYC
ncbi:hypothetical protein J3R30DRAFT_3525907 [Lentinula aciculospora]|uniref:Uncharacterized protein n=1 Tax=Lentinula aciculospora TaxID=153920 RepID=A0A9W9A095_9AGAR|nr:hypothetical protein J3R30DRAFT_3525907 [Lentinula aciculospora]